MTEQVARMHKESLDALRSKSTIAGASKQPSKAPAFSRRNSGRPRCVPLLRDPVQSSSQAEESSVSQQSPSKAAER